MIPKSGDMTAHQQHTRKKGHSWRQKKHKAASGEKSTPFLLEKHTHDMHTHTRRPKVNYHHMCWSEPYILGQRCFCEQKPNIDSSFFYILIAWGKTREKEEHVYIYIYKSEASFIFPHITQFLEHRFRSLHFDINKCKLCDEILF